MKKHAVSYLLVVLSLNSPILAEEAMDASIVEICNAIIAQRQDRINTLKNALKSQNEVYDRALPYIKKLADADAVVLQSEAGNELRATAEEYVKKSAVIDALELTDTDKSSLKNALNNIMSPKIEALYQAAKAKGQFKNLAGHSFNNAEIVSNSKSDRCVVNQGKALVCYTCSDVKLAPPKPPLVANPNAASCTVQFSIDLTNGEVLGLSSLADQSNQQAELTKLGYGSSYGTASFSQIQELEKESTIPQICRQFLPAPEVEGPAKPMEASHGEALERPTTSSVNSTVKSLKVTVIDNEGLLVGSSDSASGRNSLKDHFTTGTDRSEMAYQLAVLARNISNTLNQPEDKVVTPIPLHTFPNQACNGRFQPLTDLEAIKTLYPDLPKSDKYTISLLKEKAMALTNTKQFDVDLRMRDTLGSGLRGLEIELKGLTSEDTSSGVWRPETQFDTADFTFANPTAISLPVRAKMAGLKISGQQNYSGSPTIYNASDFKVYAQIITSIAIADILLKNHKDEVEKLVQQKLEECAKWLRQEQEFRSQKIEGIFEGITP